MSRACPATLDVTSGYSGALGTPLIELKLPLFAPPPRPIAAHGTDRGVAIEAAIFLTFCRLRFQVNTQLYLKLMSAGLVRGCVVRRACKRRERGRAR